MDRQNVTLSLPKSLLKRAKVAAVKKEKSLSQFLIEALEEKVREDIDYKKAKERQFKFLNTGFDLGTKGRITVSREELHARK
ncbi:MAG: CopG family transcriptional regulator [Thermodesulfobacteriota bacterium]